MSDSGGASFDWVVSAGSVLGIVATLTVVGAAAWKIIQVIRNKVSAQVINNRDEARKMFAEVKENMDKNQKLIEETIESKVLGGRQRYDDMKYWVERLSAQVEKNTQDVEKNRDAIYRRVEQAEASNQKVLDKIIELQTDVAKIKGMVALSNGAEEKKEKQGG
jgi:F0F1-type ATP synthase membrane subunit b/b'